MNKNLVIIILCLIIGIFLVEKFYNKKTDFAYDNYYQVMQDREKGLLNTIEERDIKIYDFKKSIESVKVLKTKTILKYEIIYKNINNLPADSLVSEFERIFAKAGVNE